MMDAMTPALRPLPRGFAATRDALHRVAELVVAPARVAATGNEIALEATAGGFGTPPFPDGGRVRVDGADLVVEEAGGAARRAPLTTLPAAAELAGLPPGDLDAAPLPVDGDGAAALAALYAFAWDVLSELRDEAPAGADPSPVRLWPEHFDVAFEQGAEDDGGRAGYGMSPGDEEHPEPYLYVGPWAPRPAAPEWNAVGFTGAELGYAALMAAPDAGAAALAFFRGRRATLLGD